jgi:hypothetical protein
LFLTVESTAWSEQEEKCIALFDERFNSVKMRTATGERPILLAFAAWEQERSAIAQS